MPRHIKSQVLRYLLAFVLVAISIFMISSFAINYHVKPLESYKIDTQNLIDDGGFETFNGTAGDCCNKMSGESIISTSKSLDVFEGDYSLNLTSSNHCACINKPVINFTNTTNYLISFYSKGDLPHTCNWITNDRKCMPNAKFEATPDWKEYHTLIIPTNNSVSASIYFYADSSGQTVTNLYDDLQVHRLIPMSDNNFNSGESYVIKTNSDNKVIGEKLSEADVNGQSYYLVNGAPNITLRIPFTQVVIIILIMLIVVRLLMKRDEERVW